MSLREQTVRLLAARGRVTRIEKRRQAGFKGLGRNGDLASRRRQRPEVALPPAADAPGSPDLGGARSSNAGAMIDPSPSSDWPDGCGAPLAEDLGCTGTMIGLISPETTSRTMQVFGLARKSAPGLATSVRPVRCC